jgi:hypothetical protein
MELRDFVGQVDQFDALGTREKIQLFAWYLHTYGGKEAFHNADIRACFTKLHMVDPGVSTYLPRLEGHGDLVRVRSEFKLARAIRSELDSKYGQHHSVVHVSKLLADLPAKVPDLAEQSFLVEALKCYRIEAYRACVVMTWNLAYGHLLQWMLKDATRLSAFNAAISVRYPKKAGTKIATYDEFLDELKESEVIEICSNAGLVSSNITKVLREKLIKRNIAAHPSTNVIVQSQADDVITDLVNNVVLHLS